MSEVENVRVVVRIRPLNKRESDSGCQRVTQVDPSNKTISVRRPNVQPDLAKYYSFDYVLKEDSTQTDVYCLTTQPIVEKVLQGYNGTVLAYGQTGTGKTYTMTGFKNRDQRGIIPNTFAHIFNHISNAKNEQTFIVHVTYLEIYNENVRDLLVESSAPNEILEVREHSDLGVFVKNLSGYIVHSIAELEKLMDIGDKNRAVGATDLNIASSRSHTIFTITVESNNLQVYNGRDVTRGKLHLVDLAGSERQSKTNATGIRLKEATKINQSLSVLGNVISALVDGKSNHIPYRNSKLTRLLQDSLGGNSKTIMITTISPSEYDYEETVSTLRYANRAKNIQNHTHINEQPKDTLLRSFQNEIEELKRQLEMTNPCTELTIEAPERVSSPKKKERKKNKKSSNENNEELQKENNESSLVEVQDEELLRTKIEQEKLREKLAQLENKVIVGGVNLIEEAQNQEFILELSASQIQQSLQTQEQLEQTLLQKEAERIDIEERYSSLQEELAGKTKKLKRLAPLINTAKMELADVQAEHQRDMEGILDTVRGLTRELQLAELIINTYIPKEYQNMIERYIHWNEDIGEYQLKCVAYTGNNMRKRNCDTNLISDEELISPLVVKYRQYSSFNRKPKRYSSVPRPTRSH